MTNAIETVIANLGDFESVDKEPKQEILDALPALDRTVFPDAVVFVDFEFPERPTFESSALDPKEFVEVSLIGKTHVVIVASNVVVGPRNVVSAPIQYLDKLARDHGGKIVGSSKSDDGGRFGFGTVTRLYAIEKV